jgi:hypothetical protein
VKLTDIEIEKQLDIAADSINVAIGCTMFSSGRELRDTIDMLSWNSKMAKEHLDILSRQVKLLSITTGSKNNPIKFRNIYKRKLSR